MLYLLVQLVLLKYCFQLSLHTLHSEADLFVLPGYEAPSFGCYVAAPAAVSPRCCTSRHSTNKAYSNKLCKIIKATHIMNIIQFDTTIVLDCKTERREVPDTIRTSVVNVHSIARRLHTVVN